MGDYSEQEIRATAGSHVHKASPDDSTWEMLNGKDVEEVFILDPGSSLISFSVIPSFSPFI
jgi:hypothetical protein